MDSPPRIVVRFAPSKRLSLIQFATSCEILSTVKPKGDLCELFCADPSLLL